MDNKSSYTWIARWYDVLLTANGYQRGLKKFFGRTPLLLPAGPKILDVGCGTGLISEILLEKFPSAQVVAFDVDEKMVEQFQQKITQWPLTKQKQLKVSTDDLFKFSAVDKFDLIVTGGVLESVPLQSAILRLKSLLAPNGFLLNIALKKNWFTEHLLGRAFNIRPYTLAENRESLFRAGFTKVDILPFCLAEFPVNSLKIVLIAS